MQKLIILFLIISTVACSNDNKLDDTFKKLQPTLESFVSQSLIASDENSYIQRRIVEDRGNSQEGLQRIKQNEYMMQKTKRLLNFIDSLKTSLKKIPNTTDKASVKKIFIVQGMGKILESSLNEYVLWLNEAYKDLENKPSFYSLTQDSLKRDFVEYNFGHAIISEVIISLTHLQIQVIRFNKGILTAQTSFDLEPEIKFNKIIVLANATSNFVAQGEDYEADMLVSFTATEVDSRISNLSLNGKTIRLNKDGIYDILLPNTSKGLKNWEAIITKSGFRKTDTTYVFQKSYQVFPKNQLDADFLKAYSESNY